MTEVVGVPEMVGAVLAVDELELDELLLEELLDELLDELVDDLLDELLDELVDELLLEELVDELLDEPTLLSSQRFVTPGSGSTKYVVLQRIPPLTASTSLTVHEVLRPKRTWRLPVKAHRSPSFAQKAHVATDEEELELDEDELELLLELLLDELELDVPEATRMLNAGSDRLALPSLTLMTILEYVPAVCGTPDNKPVPVLNVAQEGLLLIKNFSVSPLASAAVGWNL